MLHHLLEETTGQKRYSRMEVLPQQQKLLELHLSSLELINTANKSTSAATQ